MRRPYYLRALNAREYLKWHFPLHSSRSLYSHHSFLLVITIISFWSFCLFRLFRFGRFVLLLRVLVYANQMAFFRLGFRNRNFTDTKRRCHTREQKKGNEVWSTVICSKFLNLSNPKCPAWGNTVSNYGALFILETTIS